MPYLDVGDEPIYYTTNPRTDRPVLILIHGSGGSHRHWPETLGMRDEVCAVAVDLPGHGRSGGRSRNQVADYADVIDGFVSGLGLERVALAGHSLGGAVVLELALRSPAWLSRMVLVGTGSRLRVMPAILEGLLADPENMLSLVGGMCFGPDAPAPLIQTVREQLLATPAKVTHDDFSACNGFDVSERLGCIRLPTLIISGSADQLTPVKYGEFLEQRIEGARLEVMAGAGHMMALEKPDAFIGQVVPFMVEAT